MANEFKIRKGYKALSSSEITGSLKITEDLTVDGTIYGINVLSSSLQIAGDISGSFTSTSSSLALRVKNQEDFSSSLDATFATDNELSASSAGVSSSLAIDIALNTSTGSDQEGRLDTLEGKTLLSGSAQIASDISGSITIFSGSIAGRVKDNEDSLTSINGVTSSFLLNTTDTLTGDLTVTGTLTAQEFHTEYVSSSILHESGSTVFGNTSDDNHNFTGSVNILGSATDLDPEDFNNALTLTANVGNGPNERGAGLFFKQKWFGSSTQVINVGGISGVKTGANGTYGGGLAFFAQPNGAGDAEEVMRFDHSGNVGIGTTSPSAKLHVNSSDATTVQRIQGVTNSALEFYNSSTKTGAILVNSTQFLIAADNSNYLNINTGGSERMRITSTGNVGIGATSPLRKLHVVGNFAVNAGTGEYYGVNITGGEGANPTITIGDWHNSSANIKWDSSGNYLRIDAQHSTSGAPIVFSGNDSAIEYMRISSTGNVGIGDAGPSVKLQVSTNSPTNNIAALIGDGWVGNSDYHKEGGLLLISGTSQDATQTGAGIAFQTRNTANTNYWKSSMIMDRDGAIRFTLGGAGTVAGSEDFTILSGGNVGIGTTSPTAKLQVAGTTTYNSDSAQALRVCDAADVSKGIHIGFDTTLDKGIIQSGDFGVAYKGLLLNPNAGNVGIGTTSPNNKLDVNGDVFINSNYTANVAAQDLTIGKTTTGNHGLTIVTGPTYTGSIYFGDSGNNDAGIIKYQHSNNSMQFVTNRSEAIRIDSSGNVGIGTTNPGEKLTVIGKALLNNGSSLYVDSTATQTVFANIANIPMRFQTNSANRLTIGGAGVIQFNNYNSTNNTGTPTYLLGTDASGNIVKTNTIPGSGAGPYLPISAGSSYPLTGALYVQDHLILQQDGTNDLIKSTGNVLYHKANEYSFQDNSNSSWVTIKSGKVGIGTTSPGEKLVVSDSLDNDLVTLKIENRFGNASVDGTGTALQFFGWDAGITANIKSIRTGQSYSPSALTFETFGGNGTTGTNTLSERMRIDDSGKVGIGITNPSVTLHVNGWTRVNGGLQLDGANRQVMAIDNTSLLLGTNNTERMRIDASGNVGIGTTSPGVKLTVVTPNVVNTAVNVLKLGDDTNGLVFKSYFDATGIAWRLNKGLAGINMVTLSQGGNVGIGTTSPSEKLDVRDGTITSRDSGNVNYAELDRFAGLTLKGNGAGAKYISTPNTDDLGFKTNNAEKMRITSSGNVGIGTTSPGFKLDVNSSSFVGARIESTSSGYAPASILLESGHADSRGQGIYQYNSVSKNSWFSGVPYSTTSDDWVIAHKLETTAFNSDVAQMSNALFCVNDNGNVGIGTASPRGKLTVGGGGHIIGDTNFRIGSTGTGDTPETAIKFTDTALTYYVANGIKMLINSSGNVGIGTTSPGTINGVAFSSVGLHTKFGTLGRTITEGSQWGEYIMNHSGESANRRAKFIQSKAGDINIGSYDDNGTQRLHARLDNNGTFFLGNTSTAYQTVFFDSTPGTVYGNGTLQISPLTTPGSGIAQFTTNFADRVGGGTTKHNVRVGGNITGANLSGTNTGDQTLPTDFVSAANGGTFGGNIAASNLSGTNTGDQDLSGYLLNTTDTFAGNITFIGGNNNSKESFLNVKRGSGAGLWLKFQTDATSANNVSQFVIRRSTDNVDLLSITATTGATNFAGTVTGSNLSGTNTGDQDLSGYALAADYLLDTTDTLTGTLTIANSNFTGLILTRNSANGSNIDFNNSDGLLGRAGFLGDGAFAITNGTIGTYNMLHLDASGNATFTANISAVSITETSARKFKDNIVPLESQLDNIGKLNPVSFNWKKDNKQDIGLIAEEVAEVYPEMVRYEEDEVTGVNYSKLTAILIKAMQEQQKQIDELKVEITTLKSTKI